MQEFNGFNHHNNVINVDFIHKTVKFTPIPKNFKEYLHNTWFRMFEACFILSTYVWLVFSSISLLIPTIDSVVPLKLFIILLLTSTIIATTYMILYCNKNIRENIFPKFNEQLSAQTARLLFGNNKKEIKINKEYQTINPEAIRNNIFIIPNVKNIIFEYEANKDYALYLETIDIINSYIDNPEEWQIIIKWTNTPEEGEFKLRYE